MAIVWLAPIVGVALPSWTNGALAVLFLAIAGFFAWRDQKRIADVFLTEKERQMQASAIPALYVRKACRFSIEHSHTFTAEIYNAGTAAAYIVGVTLYVYNDQLSGPFIKQFEYSKRLGPNTPEPFAIHLEDCEFTNPRVLVWEIRCKMPNGKEQKIPFFWEWDGRSKDLSELSLDRKVLLQSRHPEPIA